MSLQKLVLLFEKNRAKDREDTAKNLAVGNNYAIEIKIHYSRTITPKCHTYRISRPWQEAENRYEDRVTIQRYPFIVSKKSN